MNISRIAYIVAVVYIAAGLMTALGGDSFRKALTGFSRNRIAGAILAAAAIAWTAFLLWRSPLGWFEPYRYTMPYLAAAIYFLTVCLVNELLAPRALGGLLLLAAGPVLDNIRWEPTAWRLALTLQAYAWVVAGMIVVFCPYRFRQLCEQLHSKPRLGMAAGWLLASVGLFVMILALTAF